jgi:hypothetical protein
MLADSTIDIKLAVQRQIDGFLDSLLIDTAPTATVIGVLRYGAHMPHLWKSERRRERAFVGMVLSHMIEFLPTDFFHDRSFIILDDTVYAGRQMRRHVARLRALGVPETNIQTAAVIRRDAVVQKAEEPFPLHCAGSLEGKAYRSWKRALGSLVRSQRRSVDRDHPLYFLELSAACAPYLRTILDRFGSVAVLSNQSYGAVQAFSVTADTSVLDDFVCGLKGVSLQPFSKLRFYWIADGEKLKLTVVPMVFVTVDLDSFLADDGTAFERLTGVQLSALGYLRQRDIHSFQRYVFFLTTRAIAFELLRLFLAAALPLLKEVGTVESVTPEEQDMPVKYHFPPTYETFYARNMNVIRTLIRDARAEDKQVPIEFGWPTKRLESLSGSPMDPNSGMHLRYRILEQLTEISEPIEFDGREWLAKENPMGLPVSAFLGAIKDPLLISRSLDELLDAGLLRAEDLATGPSTFDRVMLPGGESAGSVVSLLAQSVRVGRAVELPSQVDCRGWASDDEF